MIKKLRKSHWVREEAFIEGPEISNLPEFSRAFEKEFSGFCQLPFPTTQLLVAAFQAVC